MASLCLLVVSAVRCNAVQASSATAETLDSGFQSPPALAKPRVYWFWVNGDVTEEGIGRDFEWMKRAGIGGVTQWEVGSKASFPGYSPPQIEKPLEYLSPEWRQALRYSVGLANKSGLDFGISAPGSAGTAGPWVKAPEAMKKLVWSETYVQGGAPFKGRLAKPPQTTGPFQNIPLVGPGAHGGGSVNEGRLETPVYYADVETIGYRIPDSELPSASLEPTVTSSMGAIDAARLSDGDLATPVLLPFKETKYAWIQFSFSKPQRIQAVTTVILPPVLGVNPLVETREGAWLEASDDGRTFRKVADLPNSGLYEASALQQTTSFSPTLARVFRVVFERPQPSVLEQAGFAPPPIAHQIAELVLHTAARVNRFEDKAGFSTRQIDDADDTPAVAASDVVHKSDVIDLTSRMRADGSLDWTPEAGRWIVLRFGCSLAASTNTASSYGGGLDVDKLNRLHVKNFMDTYLGELEKALGAELIGRHGLQYVHMDSYEDGPQNWTDDMLEQFKRRRGYDALPWLPVLAGRVADSAAASDRFLWDFRKTLGELIAESHYGQISKSLRERGLKVYRESHEVGRAFIGDGMEVKKSADIPMGAMWTTLLPGTTQSDYDADIRESASVAHIYGKTFVAGESFTDCGNNTYGFAPESLKPIADRELAMGLNRFVISMSVHQPDSKLGPGLGFGPCGQWFTRHETWAEQAGSWVKYLTRSSYMLQQGRFVADIAYLYGEDTNVTSLFHGRIGPGSRRIQFRLCQFGCSAQRAVDEGRQTGDTRRYGISRAGARSEHASHDASGAAQDS